MKAYKCYFFCFFYLLLSNKVSAQSVILDLDSEDSGLLIPRTDTANIAVPVKGLLILDTTTMTVYVYDGGKWQGISTLDAFHYYYADRDNDTFGDKYSAIFSIDQPAGYVLDNTDCFDQDPLLHLPPTWFYDFDGDDFGDPNISIVSCLQPLNYVANNTDCDDTDPNNFPGNMEICDGLDNNCDSNVDEPENACPPTAHVLGTFCDYDNGYVCAIATCEEGYFDVNGLYADGCESSGSSSGN